MLSQHFVQTIGAVKNEIAVGQAEHAIGSEHRKPVLLAAGDPLSKLAPHGFGVVGEAVKVRRSLGFDGERLQPGKRGLNVLVCAGQPTAEAFPMKDRCACEFLSLSPFILLALRRGERAERNRR